MKFSKIKKNFNLNLLTDFMFMDALCIYVYKYNHL